MTNQTQIARRIIQLGIAPVLAACLLLLVGVIAIQRQQLHSTEQQLLHIIESSLTNNRREAGTIQEALSATAQQVLKIDPISHLSLIDKDGRAEDFGLPLPISATGWLDDEQIVYHRTSTGTYIGIPVTEPNETYWIIGGLQLSPLLIYQYRGYLLLLFVAGCSVALVIHFAGRLHRALTVPLETIITDVRQALHDESPKKLQPQKNGIYNDLVDLLNDMINRQNLFRDNMQNYVEQSTKELRETLETVEIQNIELDIARKNALQSSQAKSEFLANTSHELRTPLNGILGFTSLLLKTGLTNQQRDYLTTIEHSAQGLLTVINDILDFSKLETGQLTLEYKPTSIRDLVGEISALYAPQAHEKNLRLLTIIQHNVQQNLLGDPQRLKQVITNLVSNAIKFSARGNIVIRATSLGETDHQVEVKFSISDNGIGLTEEQQEHLFDAFSRGDGSDSRLQGGAGLGLAIVRELVKRMHGEIGVDSVPQQGSTFWFTARFGIDNKLPEHGAYRNSLYDLNLLIYDANPISRMEISHQLEYWGADYLETNTLEGVRQILVDPTCAQQVQLIILDSYKDENSFDREQLLQTIQDLNTAYRLPIIILAPPSIQRILQEYIVGLNSVIVTRPIIHGQLHQAICNQLHITHPQSITNECTPKPKTASLYRRNTKILVVDDNPANLKLACEFLTDLGMEAQRAESGAQALELNKKNVYDIIFMDVQMPGMDGRETTRLIRSQNTGHRVPIVALTAHAAHEHKTELLLAGMDDFLSKPVSESDLKFMIDRWVKDATKTSLATPLPPFEPTLELPQTSGPAADLPPQPKDSELFNWQESMSLSKQKPDLARDMLSMLIEGLPDTRQALEAANAKHDMAQLLEITHKFHGGSCYCGVPAVRAASKNLEGALHSKQYEQVEELTQILLQEIQKLEQWAAELDIDSLFADPS